jgi:hypothetical protein
VNIELEPLRLAREKGQIGRVVSRGESERERESERELIMKGRLCDSERESERDKAGGRASEPEIERA